jgi:hypothetical protein
MTTTYPAPLNSDGRYYWYGNANGVTGGQINFVGDPSFLTGTCELTWTILQRAGDGSYPVVSYSTDGGSTVVSQQVGSEGTPQQIINESGGIQVSLNGATGFSINVTSGGGTATTGAAAWILGVAITRNSNETLPWDFPNPFDPVSYNCQCMDEVVPTDTLGNLGLRMLTRLGYAAQAQMGNYPPGMQLLVYDFLTSAQKYLYKRYTRLHTRRLFRWKMVPGQRFYSLKDNDEDVLCNFTIDVTQNIEWAGIQDTRNVWYPLIEGIEPQLYTMITKPWRPARYEIRQCIEVYPAPDQTYWMWFKAHFGLLTFASADDSTTIDAELVFLHALANAKAHYGQADANSIESQANAYRRQLIAGTHGTKKYIPGTIAVPPAVRPTLIQFSDNASG